MPIKVTGPGTDPTYVDFDGGFTWLAHPDEGMQRASHALGTDTGIWLVDPIDTESLDDRLAELGDVAGIVLLVDRHERDAARLANRHRVPVTRPPGIDRVVDAPTRDATGGLPGTDYEFVSVQDGPFWTEVGLWNGETLVIPESLGTNQFSRAGDEPLGLNPFARVTPPRHLTAYQPERLLVGHGEPVLEHAYTTMETTLANARRQLPRAAVEAARALL